MTVRPRRRPLGATLLLAGVVALAVVGAPGTIAYLSAQATGPTASVTTGTAALEISSVPAQSAASVYPGGPAARLHPTAAPRVSNTGTVPLAVSVSPSARDARMGTFAGAVVVIVALQDGTACAAAPPAGAWSGVSGSSSSALVTLAPGAAKTICTWQQLPVTAPDGTQKQKAALTLTLTGTQQ